MTTASKLRRPPSGPEITGSVNGETLVWNSTTQQWEAGINSSYDFLIGSLEDWEAVVGPAVTNVYTMPGGSYALTGDVTLPVGTSVTVSSLVFISSIGGSTLTGTPPTGVNLVEVTGSTTFTGSAFRLTSLDTAGGAAALAGVGTGVIRTTGCRITASSGVLSQATLMTGGTWEDTGSLFRGRIDCLDMTGGVALLNGTELRGNSSDATACLLRLAGGDTLTLIGGALNATADAPNGVRVQAAFGDIQIIGGTVSGCDDAIILVGSVAVGSVSVHGLVTDSTNTRSITWASADVPTRALRLIGCTFDQTTPLSGFTAASTDFIVRGVSNEAGLITETAIIP